MERKLHDVSLPCEWHPSPPVGSLEPGARHQKVYNEIQESKERRTCASGSSSLCVNVWARGAEIGYSGACSHQTNINDLFPVLGGRTADLALWHATSEDEERRAPGRLR